MMKRALVLVLLALSSFALALPTSSVVVCKDAYVTAAVAAPDNTARCRALLEFGRCLADSTENEPAAAQRAADTLLSEAQTALHGLNCSDISFTQPSSIRIEDGNIRITTNEGADSKFFRFRRESVSIWDLQVQYDAVVQEVREKLQKTLNSNELLIKGQTASAEGRVQGIRSAVDILVADVSSRASQVVQQGNTATIKADEVSTITRNGMTMSENLRMQSQSTKLDSVVANARVSLNAALSQIQAKRNELRSRFDVGLNNLKSVIAATKQSVVDTKASITNKVEAELIRFNNTEANLNAKNVFPIFGDRRENTACNSSDIGAAFLNRPVSGFDNPASPATSEDELNGRTMSLPSYSHGSGYSIGLREIWNPEWSSATVYRFDIDTLTARGTFQVSRGQVMQCAGDEQGYFYGAHWDNYVFCKTGPFPSMTTERWCYYSGCTASGIAINGTHVFGVCNSASTIFVLRRDTGQLASSVTMQSFPGGTNYGIALSGTRLWWFIGTTAYEYNTNGTYRRSFGVATNPYAVFTDGERFCFSPNSNIFYCYRVQKTNFYGATRGLYWCNGQKWTIL